MTVAELQQRVDSRDFAEWMAYDRIEPIGPERADWRAAMVACVVANAFSSKGHRPQIEDFMPRFDWGVRRLSPKKLIQRIGLWLRAKKRQHERKQLPEGEEQKQLTEGKSR